MFCNSTLFEVSYLNESSCSPYLTSTNSQILTFSSQWSFSLRSRFGRSLLKLRKTVPSGISTVIFVRQGQVGEQQCSAALLFSNLALPHEINITFAIGNCFSYILTNFSQTQILRKKTTRKRKLISNYKYLSNQGNMMFYLDMKPQKVQNF